MREVESQRILTPDFVKSASLVLKTSYWSGRAWDQELDSHLELAEKSGKVSKEVSQTIRDENMKTECGREGVFSLIWYSINKGRYPSTPEAKTMIIDACWHLFSLRVADNWVDEGEGGSCLDRLYTLSEGADVAKLDHPLAIAANYLLDQSRRRYMYQPGYKGTCQRLFNLVESVEKYRDIAGTEKLKTLDKEVAFMTVFPITYLTLPFSGKPQKGPTLALKRMLFATAIMDRLGDIKKDFDGGKSYNFILSDVLQRSKNGSYGEIRSEVEKNKTAITREARDELRIGAKAIDAPVAVGMYWLASTLMYSKYLAQYEILTRENSKDLVKVAQKLVRSL